MKRLLSILVVLAGSAGIVMCCDMFRCLGLAHAAQAASLSDPVTVATVSVDNGWSLIESYGPIWGGMAIAFGLAAWLLKRNESTHWISQGRTLAIIVAVVGTGTAILSAHFAGTAWSGVLVTGVVSLFKLLQPTIAHADKQNPAPVAAASSASSLVLLIAVTAIAGQTGCAASTRESTIKTAMVAVEATDRAFVAYDAMKLADIVVESTSLEDGQAKLANYRKTQSNIKKALVTAYSAIGVAAALNDDHSLSSMEAAIKSVITAVQVLTGVNL